MSGFFITRRKVDVKTSEPFGITLMSDLHIDSAHQSSGNQKELKAAQEMATGSSSAGTCLMPSCPATGRYTPGGLSAGASWAH